MNERKHNTMVQFLQGIVEAFRFPAISHFTDIDNVDPNLVRYYRTEYGRNWKDALNEHLYNTYKNKYTRQDYVLIWPKKKGPEGPSFGLEMP